MTRFPTLASSLLMLSLAVPVGALAQGRSRGGDSGGDSGGSAGGRTSSEPSVGTAMPRNSGPSEPAPSGSSSSGGDRSSAPASVRVTGSPGSGSNPRVSGTTVRGAGANARTRDERLTRGTAQPRTQPIPRGGSDRVIYQSYYYPSSYYYPGYSQYSNYGYFGLYSPYYYSSGGWLWGGYGYRYWHDPYLYGPGAYGSSPYYWNQPQYDIPRSGRYEDEDRAETPTGSLRLKVSPRTAKVYVDGALAGVVDEFDGLSSHLRLPAGRHQIEFRAEGFETKSVEVVVEPGKTRTERASLRGR